MFQRIFAAALVLLFFVFIAPTHAQTVSKTEKKAGDLTERVRDPERRAELLKANPEADVNKDGMLTLEEAWAFLKKDKAARQLLPVGAAAPDWTLKDSRAKPQHFISLSHNLIPRFLVIDQPSPVYFPEAWPSIEHAPKGKTEIRGSADIDGVPRIFGALSHFLSEVAEQFQIIVTEHAGSITWDGIPHVHLVGNWLSGHDEFLIPTAWQKAREESE